MIKVENLSFEYPGARALDDVSFTIETGSITALVGPNGAGKTTLLRCLAALDQPHDGAIRINGIDAIEKPRQAHEKLGFLPDHFGVYIALSARQCLLYAARAHGMNDRQAAQRVEATAHDVGLEDRLQQGAGTLSRGQRQRLAIAQSIIHQPAVLLLDEPASGLDPEARAELSSLLHRLAAQGMTILVSSHILAELEAYCTAMLVLRQGRVVEHRTLNAVSGASRRMRLSLLQPDAVTAVTEFLVSQPEVGSVIAQDAQLAFDLVGGDAAQAALLIALVEQGFNISAYAPERAARLQDVYLAAVGAAGTA